MPSWTISAIAWPLQAEFENVRKRAAKEQQDF